MSAAPASDGAPQALGEILGAPWYTGLRRPDRPDQRPAPAPRATVERDYTQGARELLDAGWTDAQVIALAPHAITIAHDPASGQTTCRTLTRDAENAIALAVRRVRARTQGEAGQAVVEAAAQAVLAPGQRLASHKQIRYITALQVQRMRAAGGGDFPAGAEALSLEQVRTLTSAEASQVIDSLLRNY